MAGKAADLMSTEFVDAVVRDVLGRELVVLDVNMPRNEFMVVGRVRVQRVVDEDGHTVGERIDASACVAKNVEP